MNQLNHHRQAGLSNLDLLILSQLIPSTDRDISVFGCGSSCIFNSSVIIKGSVYVRMASRLFEIRQTLIQFEDESP